MAFHNLRPFGEAGRESHDISRFLEQALRVDCLVVTAWADATRWLGCAAVAQLGRSDLDVVGLCLALELTEVKLRELSDVSSPAPSA